MYTDCNRNGKGDNRSRTRRGVTSQYGKQAVLINVSLSVIGSYNLDMRSTYLDTELMLVIDSEKLSQQIH